MDRIQQRLSAFKDVSASYILASGDDFSTVLHEIIAAKAGETIFVQLILVDVTTDHAATQLFQDSAGTPVVIAGTKASPGIGPIRFDFGADGYALTEGKALNHKNSAAGLVGSITVQAYRKRTAVLVGNATDPPNAPINAQG